MARATVTVLTNAPPDELVETELVIVDEAFEELEDGNEDALKEVLERQKTQLRQGF
ncbi:hypothetical protein CHLNCDRAFT_139734 [Chlorella variabilis]|uniref:Uncharacterized protein n=1 Tax=Chlorella variabilis TaxID=554065 RepID=E1ZQU2_CHLVA|nr:hypothetical protein CHLNCDRAFT_139734 [Chlorella variabilis]EFN51782.1 hypothetical protein CHLNCDRAFT_139734 [Chlorella variabilis]|eukprot:XP_005843884.1 hypothetical protein CHLNCDRAFT_139734 [Chlorella variabilis]